MKPAIAYPAANGTATPNRLVQTIARRRAAPQEGHLETGYEHKAEQPEPCQHLAARGDAAGGATWPNRAGPRITPPINPRNRRTTNDPREITEADRRGEQQRCLKEKPDELGFGHWPRLDELGVFYPPGAR
ncbi:MAG TPA: hypothetical protein VFV34_12440 [Blastocatellia bacterium]|nr:hypothetical protein [Blastocatellia bacterium]